jgi:hypothetical protein
MDATDGKSRKNPILAEQGLVIAGIVSAAPQQQACAFTALSKSEILSSYR